MRNSTSKYQQNFQTPNCYFSQNSQISNKHSLVTRQRTFNIDPPDLSQYCYYTITGKTKCRKTFAKLDLQISAELPNPKLLFFEKIPVFSKRCFASRQLTFNIDPPGLSQYYCYTSIVETKCRKTFAKLDLQISAELPNSTLLFCLKIPVLKKHSLAPRQLTFNIDPPGLGQYYYSTSIVETKCQKTFAKLDLQISAELPNPKLLFFEKIPVFSKRCFASRQRTFNIDPPGLSQYYYYAITGDTKCQKTFAKLDLQISAELPNPKLLFFAKFPIFR